MLQDNNMIVVFSICSVQRDSNHCIDHARQFADKWNFPNCIGALDGKHITIQAPAKSGSYYYNYKGFHSIGLMAMVDAKYKFTFLDVGCNGRISDGGVFANCTLSEALRSGSLDLTLPNPFLGARQTYHMLL